MGFSFNSAHRGRFMSGPTVPMWQVGSAHRPSILFLPNFWGPMRCPRRREPWACGLSISEFPQRIVRDHSLVTLADPVQQLKAGDQVSLEFAEPLYFDQAGNRIGADGFRGQA